MSHTIATKSDLQMLRSELHQECVLIRKDMELLRTDISLLITNQTIRLGSMLVIGLGLLFAALRLT
jgi:hypothetical protein